MQEFFVAFFPSGMDIWTEGCDLMIPLRYFIFKPLYKSYSLIRETNKFPYLLNIELTNICNLSCICCPHNHMKRPQGRMNFGLFKKIADEVSLHPMEIVRLHLFGEPLLHPEISRFIKYIKTKKSIKNVSFSTNCFFLDKKKSKEIITSGLDTITLCLDGVTKETYEKIRVNSNFERVKKNITNFLKLRDEMNSDKPQVELQIICMQNTKDEIEKFKELWAPLLRKTDVLRLHKYVNFGGEVADRSISKSKIANKLPCLSLWNFLSICWDGVAVACCYDCDWNLKVGNVKKQSIAEIWNGKAMNTLREIQLKGQISKESFCGRCIKEGF